MTARHIVLRALALLPCLALAGCAAWWARQPIDHQIVGLSRTEQQTVVLLKGGRTFALRRAEHERGPRWPEPEEFPEPPEPSPLPCDQAPLPAAVDLSGNQTDVRHQGSRDTCTTFAAVAAVEAAIHRKYGLRLDLSEQYAHLAQRMKWLAAGIAWPMAETLMTTNGGGNLQWNLSGMVAVFGLPEERLLPYIGSGTLQNAEDDDSPVMMNWPHTYTQVELDAFNLSDQPRDYLIPEPLRTTVLPRDALAQARYRPTGFVEASAAERGTLAWFRRRLACGQEVMIQFQYFEPDPDPDNAIWEPGTTNSGAQHAMLVIGYDNAKSAFLVKNSWGPAGSRNFTWFSYDWITLGHVAQAAVIQDVTIEPLGVASNPQLFVGRWHTLLNGQPGLLDIYQMPTRSGAVQRLGSWIDAQGRGWRVNGSVSGNRAEFWIDWPQQNPVFTAAQGSRFVVFLAAQGQDELAGTWTDQRDQAVKPFVGRVAGPVPLGVPQGPLPNTQSMVGRWQLSIDGADATLDVFAVDAATGAISGNLLRNGRDEPVGSGSLAGIRFTLLAGGVSLDGLLHRQALGSMAGTAVLAGRNVGFWGRRTQALPGEDSQEDRPCRKRPWLPQCQS